MGASITMAKGAADAGLYPAVSVIGDSTFTHWGIAQGLLDAVNEKSNITIIISDNESISMTGGQESSAFQDILKPSSQRYWSRAGTHSGFCFLFRKTTMNFVRLFATR